MADKDLFDMEYWSLEQAKLGKTLLLPLQGKVTVTTGAGGAIGSALVKVFETAGAEIVAVDINISTSQAWVYIKGSAENPRPDRRRSDQRPN